MGGKPSKRTAKRPRRVYRDRRGRFVTRGRWLGQKKRRVTLALKKKNLLLWREASRAFSLALSLSGKIRSKHFRHHEQFGAIWAWFRKPHVLSWRALSEAVRAAAKTLRLRKAKTIVFVFSKFSDDSKPRYGQVTFRDTPSSAAEDVLQNQLDEDKAGERIDFSGPNDSEQINSAKVAGAGVKFYVLRRRDARYRV